MVSPVNDTNYVQPTSSEEVIVTFDKGLARDFYLEGASQLLVLNGFNVSAADLKAGLKAGNSLISQLEGYLGNTFALETITALTIEFAQASGKQTPQQIAEMGLFIEGHLSEIIFADRWPEYVQAYNA